MALSGNMVYYHFRLIARGATSYEHERKNPGKDPFSLGSWHANVADFFAKKTPPSQLLGASNPRALDEEELAGLSRADLQGAE